MSLDQLQRPIHQVLPVFGRIDFGAGVARPVGDVIYPGPVTSSTPDPSGTGARFRRVSQN